MIRRILKRLNRCFHQPKRHYEIDGFVLDMGKRIIFSLTIKKTVRCFRALFRIWENWQRRFEENNALLLTSAQMWEILLRR